MEGGGGGGRGHAAWATACPPHNTAQAYIQTTHLHLLPHLERTLQLRHPRGHNTGSNRYRLLASLDWRRERRQCLLPTVGEILRSHWTAVASLKLGSPQPVRCCPATVCHPHWVHGNKGKPEKQTATMAPDHNKRIHQKDQF